jgi:hypothetical protein
MWENNQAQQLADGMAEVIVVAMAEVAEVLLIFV